MNNKDCSQQKKLAVFEYKRASFLVRRHKHFINFKMKKYQNTDLIYIRLVYFLCFNDYFDLHLAFENKIAIFLK